MCDNWYNLIAQEFTDGWTVARCNKSADLCLFARVDDIEAMTATFNHTPESEPPPDSGWEQVQPEDLAS